MYSVLNLFQAAEADLRQFVTPFTDAIASCVHIPAQGLVFFEFHDPDRAEQFYAWISGRDFLGHTLRVRFYSCHEFLVLIATIL